MEVLQGEKLERFRKISKAAKKLSHDRKLENHNRMLDKATELELKENTRDVWD